MRVCCVDACVVIVITYVRGVGRISSTILALARTQERESSLRNMKLSRVVIDLIGDKMKPASRDR